MRITIITGPFQPLPPVGCGAVEQLWFAAAQEFARLGHSVSIISCASPGQKHREIVKCVKILRVPQYVSTSNIWINIVKDLFYSIRIYFSLPHSDILILNTFWLPIIAGYFKKKKHGKLVYNVARYPKGQIKYYNKIDRFAVVSKAIYNAVIEECPSVQNIVEIINNPINTEIFCPPILPRNFEFGIKIIYTGRVHPEKGIHLLIGAFRTLSTNYSNIYLQVVGPVIISQGGGGDTYLDRLKILADGMPVDFIPPVLDQQQLAALLQEAHIYCYPSLAEKGESFGVAPLEAMGTGLPTIVSDLECFRDFVEDGNTGIIFNHRSNDPEKSLADAIEKLLLSSKLCERMGRVAATKAKEFSVANIAKQYLDNFNELVKINAR